jgi:hypothetical protein
MVGMSLAECVLGCQARDHEVLGHEHFLMATRDLNLTHSERELMLSGWERGWKDRSQAVDNLLGAIQEAIDSLDASINYSGQEGWQATFLGRHGLKLNGRRVEVAEE